MHPAAQVETELRRAEIDLREFLHKELLGAAHHATPAGGQASYWEVLGLRVMENLQVRRKRRSCFSRSRYLCN